MLDVKRPRLLLLGVAIILLGTVILLLATRGDPATPGASAADAAVVTPTGETTAPSPEPTTPSSTSPSSRATKATQKPPKRDGDWLVIPSIGLKHRIVPQGLVGGKINPDPGQVIWFTGNDRVKPGSLGTSVVAGHIETGGRPDAFHDLGDVADGAVVRVLHANGTTTSLRVRKTLTVDKYELQRNGTVWGSNTSVRRVVLITCDDALGRRSDGHRVANFVAIAEPA